VIELRQYQKDAVDAIWSDLFDQHSALCVLPTGTGKTEVFIEFLKRAMESHPDFRAIILVNKIQLLEQTVERIQKSMSRIVGKYCGSHERYDTSNSVTVASIQSVYSVPFDRLNLVILDEVHNVDQEGGRYISFIETNKKINPKLKIAAFTATPFRANGYIYGPGKLFDRISYQKKLPEMIAKGYLVPPKMKKVNHQFDTSGLRIRMGEYMQEDVEKLVDDQPLIERQVADALSRMEYRKSAVWACASIDHCEAVARAIGTDAVPFHSKLSDEDRFAHMASFMSGWRKHLVFVSIVSEGFDHPPIDCVVLMRPIRSPVLYVQVVGRGLRPAPGKTDLLVLDYGRVAETLGPLDRPMVPDKKRAKATPIEMKFCPSCFSYLELSVTECPDCGHQFEIKPRDVTKNLTKTAAEAVPLLSDGKVKSYTVGITGIEFRKHVSKAGNICLKITYNTTDLLGSALTEYFSYGSEYAFKRCLKRLQELDCELKSDVESQVNFLPRKIPKSITYHYDDRFTVIDRLNYE